MVPAALPARAGRPPRRRDGAARPAAGRLRHGRRPAARRATATTTGCTSLPNAALLAAALTHADGDFTGSICRAVSGGWDTDSNGATAGSLAGLLAGPPAALPARWTAPLQNRLATSVRGLDGIGFDALAARPPRWLPGTPPTERAPHHDRPIPVRGAPAHRRRPHRAPGPPAAGPLTGLRVLDLATLFAGPLAATMLGDFGAEVIKVEHPHKPDPSRGHGPTKDGVGLWWKLLGRNKRTVTLDLSTPGGRDVLLRLAADADVVIENFRPGTLERWGLGWDELSRRQPPPGAGPGHRLRPVRPVRPAAPASAPSPRR